MNIDKNKKIVDQDIALHGFLDSLLTEIPDLQQQENEPVDEMHNSVSDTDGAIPEWAKTAFKGMLINVGKVTMVVPLDKINCVLPWDDEMTETNEMNSWLLGEVCHRAGIVKIIDAQQLISGSKKTTHKPATILLTEGMQYGLACHGTGDIVDLEPGQIRWRRGQTQQPWYRGIATELQCALLDIDVVIKAVTRDLL